MGIGFRHDFYRGFDCDDASMQTHTVSLCRGGCYDIHFFVVAVLGRVCNVCFLEKHVDMISTAALISTTLQCKHIQFLCVEEAVMTLLFLWWLSSLACVTYLVAAVYWLCLLASGAIMPT